MLDWHKERMKKKRNKEHAGSEEGDSIRRGATSCRDGEKEKEVKVSSTCMLIGKVLLFVQCSMQCALITTVSEYFLKC